MTSVAGLILAAIVFVLVMPYHASHIEARIREQCQAELKRLAVPSSGLIVEGRTVLLTGPVPSEDLRIEAERAVRRVRPVGLVRNFMVVQVSAARLGRVREVQRLIDETVNRRGIAISPDGDVAAKGRAVLDQVASILASHPDLVVEVQGHAGWQGTTAASKRWSEKLADSAASYLMTKGIAFHRIKTAGFGADRPVAPNSTEQGRARNRRVHFEVR